MIKHFIMCSILGFSDPFCPLNRGGGFEEKTAKAKRLSSCTIRNMSPVKPTLTTDRLLKLVLASHLSHPHALE